MYLLLELVFVSYTTNYAEGESTSYSPRTNQNSGIRFHLFEIKPFWSII